MSLITQLQGVGYSFVFGLVFTFIYHFISFYIFKIKYRIFRYIMQAVIGIVFAGHYFVGLLVINDGVIRLYFLCAILMGYIVYQNIFSEKFYLVIIMIHRGIRFILTPFRIVFYKINGIIVNTKKVIRWQSRESKKQSDQ